LADDKSKTNSLRVDLSFLVFDRAEQLENFAFVFFLYPDSVVFDRQTHELLSIGVQKLHQYNDLAIFSGELDGVGEQVEQNLLEPLLVGLDIVSVKANVGDFHSDLLHQGFVFEYLEDLLDCHVYFEHTD
jgi:hypothetical protein